MGIDVARCVALVGMMAVHVLSPGPGFTGLAYGVAGGRSAALFAVLAGVGLALGSRSSPLSRARRAVAVRAAVIAAIGLTLGLVVTPAAIILVYYAVLFLVALPVLGWPARRLAVAAGLWAIVSPVASQLLRAAWSPGGPGSNLSWVSLADPLQVATHLLLTGYYPVLTWVTYLLAGLAAGRLALGSARTARSLVAIGSALALAGWLAALVCVRLAGGVAGLTASLPPSSLLAGRGEALLDETFYGTTPTSNWWFLGVMAPHSGAIPDLVHTTGTALLVLGLALALVPARSPARSPLWRVPAAAGSMTLSLYSLHVLLLGLVLAADPDHSLPVWPVLIVNVGLALGIATWWGSPARRGPLEDVVATTVAVAVR